MLNVCFPYDRPAEQDWSYVVCHFEIDQLFVLGTHDYTCKPFKDATVVETLYDLPDVPIVLAAPPEGRYVAGEVALTEFEHPESATYVFGGNNLNFHEEMFGGRNPDHKVYIPTHTRDEMYSYVAAAVMLWDRRMKRG